MTTVILLHANYDEEHLKEVVSEMQTMGTPVIRGFYCECFGAFLALEGCHRIRAAKQLGLVPVFEEVEFEDVTEVVNDVCEGILEDDDTFETIIDRAVNSANHGGMIEFEEE